MKQLFLVILYIFGCVAFHDMESPNCATLDDVVVVEKKPMTPDEFRTWEDKSRKELNINR